MLAVACSAAACGPGSEPVDAQDAPSACDARITSWNGETLHFGLYGHPQRWLNVLGNVDPASSPTLSYSLDGQPFRSAPLGPGPLRLQDPGDFNIEIDRTGLSEGTHALELRTESSTADPCTRTLTLDYSAATDWPMPWSLAFDSIGSVEQLAEETQVVDGRYEIAPDGVRTAERGYDRLIAVGDESWGPGYQAWARFTVHGVSSWGAVGLMVGWQGHEGTAAPRTEWPVGGLVWVRNKPTGSLLEITTYDQGTSSSVPFTLEPGETYELSVRTVVTSATTMRVEAVVWRAGEAKPTDPMVSFDVDAQDGSVGLLAHTADVTWHSAGATRRSDRSEGGSTGCAASGPSPTPAASWLPLVLLLARVRRHAVRSRG